jgi:hypothetical protein
MSETIFILLTVVEAVALVVVLAVYLVLLSRGLRSIASVLASVNWGVRAVERQLSAVPPAVRDANWALEEIAATLPRLAEKVEDQGRAG